MVRVQSRPNPHAVKEHPMKKPLLLLGSLALSLLFGPLLSGSFSTAHGAEKKIVFRLGHTLSPGNFLYNDFELFKKLAEEKSGGKVEVLIYPGGQLGSDVQLVEQVGQKAIEAAGSSSNNIAAISDIYLWSNLPYLFTDLAAAQKVFAGEIGEDCKKRFEESTRYKILMYADYGGTRTLYTARKQVKTPGDLKGMKLRTTATPIEQDFVRALGANPTPIAWMEIFMGLEQGVVEGLFNDNVWIYSAKHHEVCKYATVVPGTIYATHLLLVNKEVFNAYPEDVKKALLDAARETQAANFANSAKSDALLEEDMKKIGMSFYRTTPEETEAFRQAGRGIWEKYYNQIDKKFVERVLEAQK